MIWVQKKNDIFVCFETAFVIVQDCIENIYLFYHF